jgi:hypothetical protein
MDMFARNKWALAALGFALFLTACGDLGMALLSQGSYRVNAQVDGDYTLDTYSVVTKNSDIRPYFVNSMVNDPDVRGITVFVQDYSGTIVSRQVQYLLAGDAQKAPEKPKLPVEPPPEIPDAPAAEEGPDGASDEVSRDRPPGDGAATPGEAETAAPDPAQSEDDPGAAASGLPEDLPPEPVFDEPAAEVPVEAETEPAGGADAAYPAGTAPAGTAPAGTAGDFAGADIPGVDLADAGATGTDTTDTDNTSAGATGTASTDTDTADSGATGTDTAGADTAAAPPVDIPKAPIPEDETVPVKQLDQYLPAFRIVEDLDIGRYNLVFQVMGEKEILHRTFKPIYFLRDAQFTLGEIQSFLPMAITGGRLIPPGINVMLEVEISADPRLDPYVIWHNGKNILAQGRLSAGANYLLWKTPDQTGFHSIRAEVFPLLPGDRIPGNMIGKIKELSLPVSSKSEGIQHFNDPSGEFINWYRFWGTLDDAKAPNNPERRLVSLYAKTPRWAPFGGIYGLLVGRDDVYTLPESPFKLAKDEQGTGRLLFHLAALSEGAIVNIRFAGGETTGDAQETPDSPADTAELDLSFAGDVLILRIASNDASREESLALSGDEASGFITVMVEFAIAPDHFDAELRLENPAVTTGPLSIVLAAPLSGAGVVRFGEGHGQSAQRTAAGATGKYGNGTMALNELALSYIRLPIPPKEEESESGLPETLIAGEEHPLSEPSSPIVL